MRRGQERIWGEWDRPEDRLLEEQKGNAEEISRRAWDGRVGGKGLCIILCDGIDASTDGFVEKIVCGGVSADCDTAVRERVVRTPGRVRGAVGSRGECRIPAAGAGDAAGERKFRRAIKEADRRCVCVEEDGTGGDRRAVAGVRDVPERVGGDFGDAGEAVSRASRCAARKSLKVQEFWKLRNNCKGMATI